MGDIAMFRLSLLGSFAGFFLLITSVLAQDQIPEFPSPVKQHQLLKRFEGSWSVEQEATMGPGQAPTKGKGTIKSRMLGEFWVVNEMSSEMMGVSVTGLQTIGFDSSKQKYVGTWVDSMTDYIWKYEGSLDDSGNVLTLEAEGPLMTGEGTTSYRDIYEFKSADELVLTSKVKGEDGKWMIFMTGTAKRAQ